MKKTKSQMESEISEAIKKFEKEYMGRGPLETRSYLVNNMALICLKGVLTQAEYKLAKSEGMYNGRELIKQMRMTLLEEGRPLLETVVESITEQKVISLHTDISTITGERIIVFTLDAAPQYKHTKPA